MTVNRVLFGIGFFLALGAVGSVDSATYIVPAAIGIVGAVTMLFTAPHLGEE